MRHLIFRTRNYFPGCTSYSVERSSSRATESDNFTSEDRRGSFRFFDLYNIHCQIFSVKLKNKSIKGFYELIEHVGR